MLEIAYRFGALVVAIAICGVTAADAGDPQPAAVATAKAAKAWARQNYDAVAEAVLGLPTSSEDMPPNTSWIVTFRLRPAYGVDPEVQVALTKLANGGVTAIVTKLRPALDLQLQNMHQKHESSTPAQIAKLIQLDRVTLSSAQCPALTKVATSFERIRTPIVLENELALDSRQYQLWIDAGSQREYFDLLGASNGQSKHPVIVWIEESLKDILAAIEICGSSAPNVSDRRRIR